MRQVSLFSAVLICAASLTYGQVREQDDAGPLTREYSALVRRYMDSRAQDPAAELALWAREDVRRAVQRTAGIIEALKRVFTALAILDNNQRSAAERARRESERVRLVSQLERAYDALYTGRVIALEKGEGDTQGVGRGEAQKALTYEDWRRGLPESIVAYVRGAVGLHMALAAEAWRRGVSDETADHLVFGKAYLPNLLVPLDPEYGRLWCTAGGTLLTASERHAAALVHFEECLEWFPADASLLLGRGSTLESAAILISGLPPSATLAGWPARFRNFSDRVSQAIADYQAALAQDPDLPEPLIRLSRLRLQSGDADTAAADLSELLAGTLPAVPTYWALLFRGAAEERLGNPRAAAALYQQGRHLYPNAQSAAIALSRVLAERLDGVEEALVLLREQIRPSVSQSFHSDPWWFYRMAQAWRVHEWLGQIHSRSRR